MNRTQIELREDLIIGVSYCSEVSEIIVKDIITGELDDLVSYINDLGFNREDIYEDLRSKIIDKLS